MTFTVTERFMNVTFTYTRDFETLDDLVAFARGFGDHPALIDVNNMTIIIDMPCTRCVRPEVYKARLSNLV